MKSDDGNDDDDGKKREQKTTEPQNATVSTEAQVSKVTVETTFPGLFFHIPSGMENAAKKEIDRKLADYGGEYGWHQRGKLFYRLAKQHVSIQNRKLLDKKGKVIGNSREQRRTNKEYSLK